MKKIQNLLPLLAVVAAVVFSAFTTTPTPEPKAYEDELYWFDLEQNYTGRHITKSEEIAISDCKDETSIECEYGYGPEDFNVVGNPMSGLRSTAQPNEVLTERAVK